MKARPPLIAARLLFSMFILSPTLWAAEMKPDQLPSAAREAFEDGLAAAGPQQWSVAIRSFLKAQKAAPMAPEVLFNLGLAELKVPGRELRAMAWFQACWLVTTDISNADAVRKEISNLRVRVETALDKLIGQAGRLAAQDDYSYPHYAGIAVAQAQTGDFAAALTNLSFLCYW